MFTYLENLLKIVRGDFTLSPRLAVYYVTMQCNLNCTYCEDFGSRRNHRVTPNPTLEDAKRILKVIRSGIDRLWLTGGEPLMYPGILDLLDYARNQLKFREISLITNGTLLRYVIASLREANSSVNGRLLRAEEHRPRNPAEGRQGKDIFSLLDRLIISLDSVDSQVLNLVSVPDAYAETVIANAREAALLQKTHHFKLILNAVITPETLSSIDKLIAFCVQYNASISFSPQSVNNLPRYELITSQKYRAFIERIIRLKKQDAPIFGSVSYFKTLLNKTPYECYPTLVPRILPDGWLAYPCRPMEKAGGEQGGRAVNLLNVQSWDEAWNIAKEKYGDAPTSCVSCFQQCYVEPSLMQARPLEYLTERLRGVDVSAYAPG